VELSITNILERCENMLRVAAAGYYSISNPGEEAELAATVASLQALSPKIELTVFSKQVESTSRIPGVQAVNMWNPFAVLSTLLHADIVLSCGNALHDADGIGNLFTHLFLIMAARFFGKPVVSYGQGVGPLDSYWGRRLVRSMGNRFDLITVRNQASKESLQKTGVEKPPIVVTADPVFALNPAQFDKEEGLSLLNQIRAASLKPDEQPIELTAQLTEQLTERRPDNTTHPVVKLCEQSPETPEGEGDSDAAEDAAAADNETVQPLLGIVLQEIEGEKAYRSEIAAAADRLVRDGWEVLLLPYRWPTDLQVCQEVSWIMQEPSIQLHERLTLMQRFSLLSQVDLLLGLQLPVLKMGTLMRKPCIGILRNNKTGRAAKYLEITGQPQAVQFEGLEAEQLYQLVISTSERKKEIVSHMDQVLITLRQASWQSAGLTMSYFYSRYPQKRVNISRSPGSSNGHKATRTNHH
jgi:polysaccharide pyruvyl transferase WcaK-like protein